MLAIFILSSLVVQAVTASDAPSSLPTMTNPEDCECVYNNHKCCACTDAYRWDDRVGVYVNEDRTNQLRFYWGGWRCQRYGRNDTLGYGEVQMTCVTCSFSFSPTSVPSTSPTSLPSTSPTDLPAEQFSSPSTSPSTTTSVALAPGETWMSLIGVRNESYTDEELDALHNELIDLYNDSNVVLNQSQVLYSTSFNVSMDQTNSNLSAVAWDLEQATRESLNWTDIDTKVKITFGDGSVWVDGQWVDTGDLQVLGFSSRRQLEQEAEESSFAIVDLMAGDYVIVTSASISLQDPNFLTELDDATATVVVVDTEGSYVIYGNVLYVILNADVQDWEEALKDLDGDYVVVFYEVPGTNQSPTIDASDDDTVKLELSMGLYLLFASLLAVCCFCGCSFVLFTTLNQNQKTSRSQDAEQHKLEMWKLAMSEERSVHQQDMMKLVNEMMIKVKEEKEEKAHQSLTLAREMSEETRKRQQSMKDAMKYSKPLALLIANWRYDAEGFSDLDSPRCDLMAAQHIFKEAGFTVVPARNQNSVDILSMLESVAQFLQVGPVVLYYSGHGSVNETDPESLNIIGVDGGCVEVRKNFLAKTNVRRQKVVLIADCCRVYAPKSGRRKNLTESERRRQFGIRTHGFHGRGGLLCAFAAPLGEETMVEKKKLSPLTAEIVSEYENLHTEHNGDLARVIAQAGATVGHSQMDGKLFQIRVIPLTPEGEEPPLVGMSRHDSLGIEGRHVNLQTTLTE